VVDYCGQVSGDDVVGEYNIRDAKAEFRDYYAQLTFDRGGKLAKSTSSPWARKEQKHPDPGRLDLLAGRLQRSPLRAHFARGGDGRGQRSGEVRSGAAARFPEIGG